MSSVPRVTSVPSVLASQRLSRRLERPPKRHKCHKRPKRPKCFKQAKRSKLHECVAVAYRLKRLKHITLPHPSRMQPKRIHISIRYWRLTAKPQKGCFRCGAGGGGI